MAPARSRAAATPSAADAPPSVVAVIGDDDLLVSRAAAKWAETLRPPGQGDGLELDIVEGEADLVGDAAAVVGRTLQALESLGLFGGEKLVWLRNATFLSNRKIMQNEEVKRRLERLRGTLEAGLAPGVRLLIQAGPVGRDHAFGKALRKLARCEDHSRPAKPWEHEKYAIAFAREEAARIGIKLRPDLAERLVQTVGTHSRQIASELGKLRVYLGDRDTPTERDLADILSPSPESGPFDLNDTLGHRDPAAALQVLAQLRFQRQHAMATLAFLQHHLRSLILMKTCLGRKWVRVSGDGYRTRAAWTSDPEVTAQLDDLKPDPRTWTGFRLGNLVEQVRNFRGRELVDGHLAVLNAHMAITTGADPDLALEQAVIRIATPSPSRRSA